jgi:hypothetical protein
MERMRIRAIISGSPVSLRISALSRVWVAPLMASRPDALDQGTRDGYPHLVAEGDDINDDINQVWRTILCCRLASTRNPPIMPHI